MSFRIEKKARKILARTGVLETPHGVIRTPAFAVVGTKATVKALSPEEVKDAGAEVVLGNTYHLYLEPGPRLIKKHGGLGAFMNWSGPTMTDSGGFQVFSLGEALGKGVSKVLQEGKTRGRGEGEDIERIRAIVNDEGVAFKSPTDGSSHFFTPEKSIDIQHDIGADILFAFDECTSPSAPRAYQEEALVRTHAWAERSLVRHKKNAHARRAQKLFGVIQGGRFKDLRERSARVLREMDFDGFGIGGSFDKKDIQNVVGLVNRILPEDRPRHLLGIGEPEDLFLGVEAGIDLFDCVAPTRIARTGQLYTKKGKINIRNARWRTDMGPIEKDCLCSACRHYTKSYLAHLFRARELLAYRLASIHNVFFIVNLVRSIRESILDGNFPAYRKKFLTRYRVK